MTWTDLEKNKIYVSEFSYQGKPATIIFEHNGKIGHSKRKRLNALGQYADGHCCSSDARLRLPTLEEEQSLLKHLKPEKHYEIY